MFEAVILLIVCPVLVGVCCAVLNLASDAPFPITRERRQPWPNPFR